MCVFGCMDDVCIGYLQYSQIICNREVFICYMHVICT